jgi:indolepyruvate ferredoxin oxidoreductase alpha subunit
MGLIKGCGVTQVEEVDPYDLTALMKTLRRAQRHVAGEKGSVAVVVARHACVAQNRALAVPQPVKVRVTGAAEPRPPAFDAKAHACADCGRCVAICPAKALTRTGKAKIKVDAKKCVSCRLCAEVCPTGTMVMEQAQGCTGCGICLSWFACPALKRGPDGRVEIDRGWCVDCGLCAPVCAQGAIVAATEGGEE